ncbi:hypothetical protein FDA36_02665 [Clostridium botulinum]|nr:hypothetical protein [Clostridium botulinum]
MVKFKEFKIIDVLNWRPQKEIDPLKVRELTVENENKYPFYGQATINNGIISYLSLTDEVLNNKDGKPTILIHSNNQNIVYLETPFYLKDGHGATSVLQADLLNEKIALYIMTCIKKVISKNFTYNKKATKIALKNTTISLPVDEDDNIDFDFMENFIKKIEKENTNLFLEHLKKENLNTSILSKDEKSAINLFENNEIKYMEIKIGTLFDIHPTKYYRYTNSKLYETKGNVPVMSNSSLNNGIGGYVGLEPTEKGGMITFSDTTLGAKTIFYQPIDFIGYSHVQGLYPYKPELWSENSLLYFISAFKKASGTSFDYSIKFNREIVSDLVVKLPILPNNEIDFKFMENYIDALKKISIKNII